MLRSSVLVVSTLALAFASGCGGGGGYYAKSAPEAAYAGRQYPGAPPPASLATATTTPAQAQPGMPVPAEETAPKNEAYKDYGVNPFVETKQDKLSTFSIDVDTASYSIARRFIAKQGTLPPYQSVRAEEFLNSFDYGYEKPGAQDQASPFKVHYAAAPSPFTKGHHLVRVGVQAKAIAPQERQPVHLVYLVDTSGSMGGADRIELAKKSLEILTDTLKPGDTVAICTYAGSTKVVLHPTSDKKTILSAIRSLETGGGTAMGSGIQLAYELASKTLQKGHVNRVVVLSDGDANIGRTSHEELLKSIEQYKNRGITLSAVGYGSGNYKDTMMETLADKGDGNYSYIDSEREARKVFGEQADGLLQVVARDVKIQVELDPNVIRRYRLIGYENRDIADKDFRNDKVDAGEVGAGHSVTALYDVELVDPSKTPANGIVVRMRHKPAKNTLNGGSDTATEKAFEMPSSAWSPSFEEAPESYRFAVSVAAFAEILRKSPHAVEWKLADVARIAQSSSSQRPERAEFVSLVGQAARLTQQR
jgi:Ca-activated chloride channel homolog